MADLLKWSPLETSRWTAPFEMLRRGPFELLDSMERMFGPVSEAGSIRVEEFVDDKTLVVRADMPGVDPDKDIDVSVSDGVLHISAQRQEKTEQKDKDRYRSEFRYGSFSRDIPIPEGVKDEDIKASYKDGVLEVRTPLPDGADAPAKKKLQITRS
ncbi:Hsp20/alpha crystallin family protein [Paenarthrobacter sp. DKR-5]|uniref:Hsp20/alpha crystallin family protein n=1 Tax=Paenarthrobacter sp. DKR-5 TaxID=2835535 RepID=UPI001BDD866C|nr:Hsp20/alpha crystallin family protein [Paenarthrobacter sp. DKR-5]MBT1002006.1 Hsp20/alpha crystallin family protein [Paenarthrobacter sp. DKR-5]